MVGGLRANEMLKSGVQRTADSDNDKLVRRGVTLGEWLVRMERRTVETKISRIRGLSVVDIERACLVFAQ